MANEISIQASLVLQRSIVAVQGSDSKSRDQLTGTKGISIVKKAITGTAVPLITTNELTTTAVYYIFAKNLSDSAPADVLDIGYDSSVATPIARLKGGDFCLIPVPASSLIWVKRSAGTGTPDLMVVAVEGT
jgi:hypothetical protein